MQLIRRRLAPLGRFLRRLLVLAQFRDGLIAQDETVGREQGLGHVEGLGDVVGHGFAVVLKLCCTMRFGRFEMSRQLNSELEIRIVDGAGGLWRMIEEGNINSGGFGWLFECEVKSIHVPASQCFMD